MHSNTLPTHPRSGLVALGYRRNGQPIWPILGASEPAGEPAPGGEPAGGKPDGGDGGWKPPASAEEFNRIIQDRLGRERAKFGGMTPEQIADLQAKAEQFDALAAASQTDMERSVAEAAEQARWIAEAEIMPRLVDAEVRAAAALAGKDLDKLTASLELLDRSKLLTDDGQIDSAKLTAFVGTLANREPVRPNGPSSSGLGNRGGEVRMGAKEQAAAQIAKRFPTAAAGRN